MINPSLLNEVCEHEPRRLLQQTATATIEDFFTGALRIDRHESSISA